jgi:hypothetical protein
VKAGAKQRQLCSCWFLAQLILWPWRWRWYVPPNRQLVFNILQGVITQKIVLFITALVRTFLTSPSLCNSVHISNSPLRLSVSSYCFFNTTCFSLTGHHQQVCKIVDENCCSVVTLLYFAFYEQCKMLIQSFIWYLCLHMCHGSGVCFLVCWFLSFLLHVPKQQHNKRAVVFIYNLIQLIVCTVK